MVSSLPNELLRQIVESTRPDTLHLADYKERQKTLCSLSLTSKTFRSIAQPLLLEFVLIESPEDFRKKPRRTLPGLRGAGKEVNDCEWLIIRTEDDPVEPDEVEEWLQEGSGTRILVLQGLHDRGRQNLASLNHFSNLRHLLLSFWESASSANLILPELRSLAFHHVERFAVMELFKPSSLPKLEEVALVDCWEIVEAMKRSSLDQLLPQLQALSFEKDVWTHPEATFLHSSASKTIITLRSDELDTISSSAIPFVNIRISGLRANGSLEGTPAESLERLTTFLQSDLSPPLESIYLNHSFRPISSLPAAIYEALQNLSQVCQRRKIELVVPDGLYNEWEDPCVLPEFSRRQRERRRKEISE